MFVYIISVLIYTCVYTCLNRYDLKPYRMQCYLRTKPCVKPVEYIPTLASKRAGSQARSSHCDPSPQARKLLPSKPLQLLKPQPSNHRIKRSLGKIFGENPFCPFSLNITPYIAAPPTVQHEQNPRPCHSPQPIPTRQTLKHATLACHSDIECPKRPGQPPPAPDQAECR